MAFRIFQLGIVFTIGIHFRTEASNAKTVEVPEIPFPLQLRNPDDVTVCKGQSATFRCDLKSMTKNNDISWLYNGQPILKNDTRRIVKKDGSLFISKVTSGKKNGGFAGEYSCLVRTNHGALLSTPAKLRVASIDRDFDLEPTDLNVNEFQPAVFFCNIHSIPTAQIRWEYNNSTLPQSTRYVPLPSGALLITKVLSSDEGSYRCVATNSILQKTKYSKDVKLTVYTLTDAVAPTFLPLDNSFNKTILIGDNLDLYCFASGWPTPNVQWFFNGSIVSNSSRLELRNVTLNQTGNYVCVAHNNNGRVMQNYNVEVQQKPYFILKPASKIFPSAITIRLECQAKGVPEPKVYWLKDGKSLPVGGRIRKQQTGLIFSHTFTYDSGFYQCVAVNAAGKTWIAAQLLSNSLQTPSPPENVQCRSYDDRSVCLTWDPPANVSVQAYSVYSFYTDMKNEIYGPDYLTNLTHQLAIGLNGSTNYTFYVRLYSNVASDQSKKVICQTGIKGSRDMQIYIVNNTSVNLSWHQISNDVPCGETTSSYRIEWRQENSSSTNTDTVTTQHYRVDRLIPQIKYEFRVTSLNSNLDTPWQKLILPKINANFSGNLDDFNHTDAAPIVPEHLEAKSISSTSVTLSWWNLSANTLFYTVCFTPVNEEKPCESSELVRSETNFLPLENLKPNTLYEFKVRGHFSETVFSEFSYPLQVQTLSDVPSPVNHLRYKIINETTACVHWQAPSYKSTKLTKYLISYTPDKNWPLEKWMCISVPTSNEKSEACWLGSDDTISTLLVDLKPEKQYTVLVRAASELGVGNPTVPIVVTTYKSTQTNGKQDANHDYNSNTIQENQKLGIIMGVSIAAVCIVFSISCILVRRQCVKRRSLIRERTASSSNYSPAVAHYATQSSSVQIRLEDPCMTDVHEGQHLFGDEQPVTIPSVATSHLDTKGAKDFQGICVNGSPSRPYLNGNVRNNNIHITENPQCYMFKNHKSIDPEELEEDNNLNVKISNYHDMCRDIKSDIIPDETAHLVSNNIEIGQKRISSSLGPNG